MKTAPGGKDGLPGILMGLRFEVDSVNDLVVLELRKLVIFVAIGVVFCEESLCLFVTSLLDWITIDQ